LSDWHGRGLDSQTLLRRKVRDVLGEFGDGFVGRGGLVEALQAAVDAGLSRTTTRLRYHVLATARSASSAPSGAAAPAVGVAVAVVVAVVAVVVVVVRGTEDVGRV
jgi:hypothetical protein